MKNTQRATWGAVLLVALWMSSSTSALAASSVCGITIITHGFQPPGRLPIVGSDGALPDWASAMAKAIRDKVGGAIPIYRVRYDKATDRVVLQDGVINLRQAGGCVVLFDWVGVSNEFVEYPTQRVGRRFFTALFEETGGRPILAEVPIHFVGHSRGASLNSYLSHELALSRDYSVAEAVTIWESLMDNDITINSHTGSGS
ncbi:MAG: hypothetical protein FJ398_27170, partial [Verrucomicrobia bacterium]|nr:hypothetical protein [Verrucomicrobiota bacterium]